MPSTTKQREKTVPGPYSWADSIVIVSNDKYEIKDLTFRDGDGVIRWSLSITTLHPGQQTRGHSHDNDHEMYEFIEGQGVMLLGTEAKMVKAGDNQFVPKEKWHKLINIGQNTPLVFKCSFQGDITAGRPSVK